MDTLRKILQTSQNDIIRIFAINSTKIDIDDIFLEEFKTITKEKIQNLEKLLPNKIISEYSIKIHKDLIKSNQNLIKSNQDIYTETYEIKGLDKESYKDIVLLYMKYSKQNTPLECFPNLKSYDDEYILHQTTYSNNNSSIQFILNQNLSFIEIKQNKLNLDLNLIKQLLDNFN